MHKYDYGKVPTSSDNRFTPLMNWNPTQSYKLNLAAIQGSIYLYRRNTSIYFLITLELLPYDTKIALKKDF